MLNGLITFDKAYQLHSTATHTQCDTPHDHLVGEGSDAHDVACTWHWTQHTTLANHTVHMRWTCDAAHANFKDR